jgi:hypothetical protein
MAVSHEGMHIASGVVSKIKGRRCEFVMFGRFLEME